MARGDAKRVRGAVRSGAEHVGYVTTVGYPDRDIAAFPEGTPHFEVVVSDLAERHVALLQQFKAHWLIHCGAFYETTDAGGPLTDARVREVAEFALRNADLPPRWLAEVLKERVEGLL